LRGRSDAEGWKAAARLEEGRAALCRDGEYGGGSRRGAKALLPAARMENTGTKFADGFPARIFCVIALKNRREGFCERQPSMGFQRRNDRRKGFLRFRLKFLRTRSV
jgi:hypothetical protein